MTDLFKCKKSGTQCCAPKSVIREHLERKKEKQETSSTKYPDPHGMHSLERNSSSGVFNIKYSPTPSLSFPGDHTTLS